MRLATLLCLGLSCVGLQAQSFSALPDVDLPAVPSGPGLLFGSADVAGLQARRSDPLYSADYQSVKGLVDSKLGSISSNLGDDLLSKLAKGAAALEQLGEIPASGPHASYRDAAVAAILAMGSRSPTSLFGGGNLVPDKDAGMLNSMAEAYDLLRATGVSAGSDSALRAKLENWAQAFANDGFLPFRNNNLSLKSGCAMVSTALAMPGHALAQGWLDEGQDFINGALSGRASQTGWYREGPHYINYVLNNLISTALHVKNRTGVDWFPSLLPFARFAIDTRQPDGSQAPFEEGVSNTFPHHTLLSAFAGQAIQAEMAWAYENGSGDLGNYDVAQLHRLTAFVLRDAAVSSVPPSGSPTRFIGGDAHVHVLRSGWDSQAQQATMVTAQDYSSLALITSRHNTQNPLDLVIAGAGETLLPTSGGGPQVTLSSHRDYYLEPSSRNLVLVEGSAPFVTSAAAISSRDRLDSQSAPWQGHELLDFATTSVQGYGNADSVERSLGMVDNSYFIVADAVFDVQVLPVAQAWHGRGTFSQGASGPDLVQASWSHNASVLDLWSVGNLPLASQVASGYRALSWGQEETAHDLQVQAQGIEPHFLTVLQPRASTAGSLQVTRLTASGVLGLQVDSAASQDLIGFAPQASSFQLGGLAANARLVLLRLQSGLPAGFALIAGDALSWQGQTLLSADQPVSLSLTLGTGKLQAQVSRDQASTLYSLRFQNLPGFDMSHDFEATFAGQLLGASQFAKQGNELVLSGLSGGGSLFIESTGPASTGNTGNSGNSANTGNSSNSGNTGNVGNTGNTGNTGNVGNTGSGNVGSNASSSSSSGGSGGGSCAVQSGPSSQSLLGLLLLFVAAAVARRSRED